MYTTAFFPGWSRRFRSRGATVKSTLGDFRRCTLDKLEEQLGPFFSGVPELAAPAAGARERPYSVRRTWWCLLWQMLQQNVSCREVVRQLQAMLVLEGRPNVDSGTSAYCQARERVPEALLEKLLTLSAHAAERRVTADEALQGRVVKVVDGTTLTLPDTAENQELYPQPSSQKPGCGFALMRLLVVWGARGGTILHHVKSACHHAEMRLLHLALPCFSPNDIVIYDRAAGHYMACALLRAHRLDLISRVLIRKIDWRRGTRLGPLDRLVQWKKTAQMAPYLTAQQWADLPDETPVRVIRIHLRQKGFRARTLDLVTTLLDPLAYPREQISAAYLRRWRIEMCLDDLKTTLGLDHLRCKTPATVHRELLTTLISHNLVRAVMAEASQLHAVALDRLSFTGTLHSLRTFCSACAHSSRPCQRRRLWSALLKIVASDLVPLRPHRCEPRALKRRHKDYPFLTYPRHLFRTHRHSSTFSPLPQT